jgi:hypothetical protein
MAQLQYFLQRTSQQQQDQLKKKVAPGVCKAFNPMVGQTAWVKMIIVVLI